jgi:serine/threonine protein kinase
MESSNKDLFEHYCEITELPVTEQKQYINGLKEHEFELANKLDALVNNNSDLTQVFTDSILDLTDENQLASVGDRLTNYKLTQTLGKGGMGQVFKAERCDGKIEQTVAIKFLHPLFYQYQSGKLLLQEAQALAQLNHPNIASIYDIAETDNGNAYIIMEYVEGVTLDVYLQQNCLSVANKLSLFNQIADAVLEAHNHQIIHADIKPSNVLITTSGQAKLIDFGVMQLTGELTKSAPKLVTHYLCAMTVNYASPEQLNGDKASISSDIYGLGGLLYFMLSGKSPFEEVGGTLTNKIENINTKAPDICSMTDKILFKSDLIGVLNKALSKQPKDRYRTVTDFISDIEAFQQKKVVSVSASNRFQNSLKYFYRNRIINTAIVSIFIIIFVAFIQVNSKKQQIIQEKQSLANVNKELKRIYSQKDKSLENYKIEGDVLHLPEPSKLEPENYVEVMLWMFDDYYHKQNQPFYSKIIDTLTQWLTTQNILDPLTINLIKYRKILSDNEVGADYIAYEKVLKNILQTKQSLEPKVLDIFWFQNINVNLVKKYLLKIFIRFEDEVIISGLSIEKSFLFHNIGGQLYSTINFETAAYHYQKAYQIAKNNMSEIKLWLFIDVVSGLYATYEYWKGPSHERLSPLKEELIDLISHADTKSKRYATNLNLILDIEIQEDMESIEEILKKNKVNFSSSIQLKYSPNPKMLRYQSMYLKSLGKYDQAVEIAKKASYLLKIQEGGDTEYYNYFLVAIAYHYLDAGETTHALALIEDHIIPFSKEHEEQDYLGYYQAKFCYRLALIENTERLKKLCFDGFTNLEESLGIDNYWTRYTASGVVAWYTLQPPNDAENYYVELLETEFDDLLSREKIRRGIILERYFLSREKIEKASYYQLEVKLAIEDYYGSVDAIDRYYHQVMAAELALLKNAPLMAKQSLSKVKDKLCDLDVKNPHRIKYIKLTESLNMSNCNAI